MANPYYTYGSTIALGSKARSSTINTDYTAVQAGFDAVYTDIKSAFRFTGITPGATDLVITSGAGTLAKKVLGFDATGLLAALYQTIDITVGLTADLIGNNKNITAINTLTATVVTGLNLPVNPTDAASRQYVLNTAFNAALPSQTGNARKIVRTDGSTATWGDAFGAVTRLTSGTTLVARTRYHIDSSGGVFNLTMPASPAADDWVHITDVAGQLGINNVTLLRNGSNIMALAEDCALNLNYLAVMFVYDSVKGWVFST